MSEQGSPPKDPTELTQQAVDRLERSLKEFFGERFITVEQKFETLCTRVHGIEERVVLAEKLRLELKGDNEKNIDKALTGVKDANQKLEDSITRTLTQMNEASKADNAGLRRDIDALKDRLNDTKERIVGAEQQKVGAKEDRTGLYAAIAAFGGLLVIVTIIIGFMAVRGGP